VASNSVIKNLIARGGVATIMHFGTVISEIDAGVLAARRIVNPTLKRTLCLARRTDRQRSTPEDRLLDLLGRALLRFVERAGPIARPLPALSGPLSDSLPDFSGASVSERSI
jgi:DNA-binding transcriptional LysR family regulator